MAKKNKKKALNKGVVALTLTNGNIIVGDLEEDGDEVVLRVPLEMIKKGLYSSSTSTGFAFQKHAMLNNDINSVVTFNVDHIVSMYYVEPSVEILYRKLVDMYSTSNTDISILSIDDNPNELMKYDSSNKKIDFSELRKKVVRSDDYPDFSEYFDSPKKDEDDE